MARARKRVRILHESHRRDAAATTDGLTAGGGTSRRVPRLLGLLAAISLVVSVALVLPVTDQAMLNAPGGPATTIGRVAGLAGTYLLLITLLLIGRIPLIEEGPRARAGEAPPGGRCLQHLEAAESGQPSAARR
jgi:hypothetical protein